MVLPLADKVLASDLGADVIWQVPLYAPALERESAERPSPAFDDEKGAVSLSQVACRCDAGDGPRHFAVSKTKLLVLNELSCTLSCFELATEAQISKINLMPVHVRRHATAAALRVTDVAAYCSLRLVKDEGIVVVVPVDPLTEEPDVALLKHYGTGGITPRDIQIVGKRLFVANQDSHSIVAFDLHPASGVLLQPPTHDGFPACVYRGVRTPVCILELPTLLVV